MPEYVDIDEEERNGPVQGQRKPAKKLFGKTDLQTAALAATGRRVTGFRDNAQLKKFTDLEANCIGATANNRVWAAWFKHRIAEAVSLNTKMTVISMDKLIYNISLKSKREQWMNDNRARVLSKPSAQELASTIAGVKPGADAMEEEMLRRMNNEE